MKNYVVEYQTEEEAVREFHRTSINMFYGLIVLSGIIYLFH